MTSQSQVERPDLDALFADLAHPNPHLSKTQAYLAMVDHWPNESMPRLISLLDQPDVSLRRAAVRGLGAFGAIALQPLAELFEVSTDGTVRASCVKAYAQIASNYPGSDLFLRRDGCAGEGIVGRLPRGVTVGGDGPWSGGVFKALPLLIQICKGDNIAHVHVSCHGVGPKFLIPVQKPVSERCWLIPPPIRCAGQMVEASLGRLESSR